MFKTYRLALTSAPEEDYLAVHLPISDSSTRPLATLLRNFIKGQSGNVEDYSSPTPDSAELHQCFPHMYVDPVLENASEDVFNAHLAILVGVGNGVMPLASILKRIHYCMGLHKAFMVQKVYFFWICDDLEKFRWFQSLLLALEFESVQIQCYLVRNP